MLRIFKSFSHFEICDNEGTGDVGAVGLKYSTGVE